jgi:hypothetical protein
MDNISNNIFWFMGFGAIGMFCNWWLLFECVKLGFKHRTYSIALFATYFWTAHDISFVLQWHTWFVEMDFWVWKLFWVNILLSVVFEVFFYYQMIKFGLNELFPGLPRKTALCLLFGGQVIALAVFWYVKMAMGGDPMFLSIMVLTIFACPIFAIPTAMRRRSRKGQSIRLNLIYIIMVFGIWPAWYITAPAFQSVWFIALGAGTVVWCLANILVLKSLPAYSPVIEEQNPQGAVAVS